MNDLDIFRKNATENYTTIEKRTPGTWLIQVVTGLSITSPIEEVFIE
jgi:hypothetical protein